MAVYGVVIEGHLVRDMRNELARENGPFFEAVEWLKGNCCIAVTPRIENHWKTLCGTRDLMFWIWYEDQVKNKVIREVRTTVLDSKVRIALKELGVPPNPFTEEYIRCAEATEGPRLIVAEEMELHEPRAGGEGRARKDEIRRSRSGSVCRYLERSRGIRVGTLDYCRSQLQMGPRRCSDRSCSTNGRCRRALSR